MSSPAIVQCTQKPDHVAGMALTWHSCHPVDKEQKEQQAGKDRGKARAQNTEADTQQPGALESDDPTVQSPAGEASPELIDPEPTVSLRKPSATAVRDRLIALEQQWQDASAELERQKRHAGQVQRALDSKEQTLAESIAENRRFSERVASLETELLERNARVRELSQTSAGAPDSAPAGKVDVQSSLNAGVDALAKTRDECRRLAEEKGALQDELVESKRLIDDLHRCFLAETGVQQQRAQIEQLEQRLRSAKTRSDDTQANLSILMKDKRQLTAERESLTRKYQRLEKRRDDGDRMVVRVKRALSESNAALDETIARASKLKAERDDQVALRAEQELDHQRLLSEIADWKTLHAEVSVEAERRFAAHQGELEKKFSTLDQAVARLEPALSSSRSELEKSRKLAAKLTAERDAYVLRCAEADTDRIETVTKLESVKQQFEQLQVNSRVTRKALKRTAEQSKQRIELLESELKVLVDRLAENESSVGAFGQRVRELDAELLVKQGGLNSVLAERDKEIKRRRSLEARTQTMNRVLSSTRTELDKMRTEVESQAKAIRTKKEQIVARAAELEDQSTALTSRFAAIESRIRTIESIQSDRHPPAQGGRQAVLVAYDVQRTRHVLGLGTTFLGRTGDNDVKVGARFVSRRHARIVGGNGAFVIEDLGSKNGVFVNSCQVMKKRLAHGDLIDIGDRRFRFEMR